MTPAGRPRRGRRALRITGPALTYGRAAVVAAAVLSASLAAAPASAAPAGNGATAATTGSTDAARPAATSHGGNAGDAGPARVVRYHGYQIRVPASWPVYSLAADASRCVLFNTHAVYLGTPGADERCPAQAFGRTEAVLVQPEPALLPPGTVVLPRGSAALPVHATLPASLAAQAGAGHAFGVAVQASDVLVTATYGTDPALIREILATATLTGPGRTGATRAGAAARAAPPGPRHAQRALGVRKSVLRGEPGTGLGFDACTAPSVTTMSAWLASPYRVAGTYLGGANWACTYGNFNATWVSQVAAQGWQFIPIWVGLQAPCTNATGVTKINPARAAAEGKADATGAVAAAKQFGYGSGTPVYFDMESYNNTIASCSKAVLTFLGAWTKALHAAGYLSGVYSGAASGIHDLASKYGSASYPRPDDIWIADWTGDPVLTDPFVPAADWPGRRLHQYYGAHNEAWGGATVNVDNDVIGGTVAGLPGGGNTPRPAVLGRPDAVSTAPGTPTTAKLTIRGTAQSGASAVPAPALRARSLTAVSWRADPPAGITVTPSHGVTTVSAGGTATVKLTVTPAASLAAGRYDVPVTASAGHQPVTETFVLVSAVQAGATLPTAYPVVLYAADHASMAIAVAEAKSLALPASDVTGTFVTAWNDLTGGSDLLLAVGKAADNALFLNPCGWKNPAGTGAGSTPFSYLGTPLQQPAGTDNYEPSDGSTGAATTQLTAQLSHYALAGTLPNEAVTPDPISLPTKTCLGSPNVKVP
jgi:hypothetical protein